MWRINIIVLVIAVCINKVISFDALTEVLMEVHQREVQLKEMLGPYKIYIYEGGAFDALSTDLITKEHANVPVMNEYRAPIWIHRALQNDPSRTMDPSEADIFFVPGYLQVSYDKAKSSGSGRKVTKPDHDARLENWVKALKASPWYRKSRGKNHLFASGDLNPGWSAQHGLPIVQQVLSNGYIGTFEMNGAWVGGDAWPMSRLIAIPYVAADDIVMTAFQEITNNTSIAEMAKMPRHVSLYFAASERKNAITWANCTRRELEKVAEFPHAVVHVHAHRRLTPSSSGITDTHSSFKPLVSYDDYYGIDESEEDVIGRSSPSQRSLRHSEASFADHMRNSAICPLMCGDTPTSRRTYDAYVAGCVPLFVGTRLWGRCDEPCRPGWGWRVSGATNPHLPFHGLWLDWRRFPLIDELELVSQSSKEAVEQMHRVLKPMVDAGGGNLNDGVSLARAYLFATRKNLIYGFGDCRTSEHFGLAPRRLVESALFRMKNIDTTGYLKSSLGNAVGNAGNAAGLLHPLQPLQHTIDAVEAPQSESMLKYHEGIARAQHNARLKKEKEEEKEFGKASDPSPQTPLKSAHASETSSLSSSSTMITTAEMTERHSDFVAMRTSLFDWLKAPVSLNKGEDLSEKKVLRTNE